MGGARHGQAGARELLRSLEAEVQETIDELRALAHGIYPPLLMDQGLAVALDSAGHRSALPVTVEADGVGRYPSEIEAAISVW